MVLGLSPVGVTSLWDFAPASSKEFLDIQATIECRFNLNSVCDMTRTYSQLDFMFANVFKILNDHFELPDGEDGLKSIKDDREQPRRWRDYNF